MLHYLNNDKKSVIIWEAKERINRDALWTVLLECFMKQFLVDFYVFFYLWLFIHIINSCLHYFYPVVLYWLHKLMSYLL